MASPAPSDRDLEDAYLANTIVDIPDVAVLLRASRVHAELQLGLGILNGRKRVARPLRITGDAGPATATSAAAAD